MLVWIVATVVLVPIIAVMVGTRYVMHNMFTPHGFTEESAFARLENAGLYSRARFEALPKEEVTLTSHDGLSLHGFYVEPCPDRNKVMIVVHGFGANYVLCLPYAEMFIAEGFNVLLISQRAHGRSGGKHPTFGCHEKRDLDQWVDWVVGRKGGDAVVGLFGQSMGGATVLEYAGINRHARFIIADCPYSDMTEEMQYQFAKRRLPVGPATRFTNWVIRRKLGFTMSDVSPIHAIRGVQTPILWIHGADDRVVPVWMSQAMYDVKQGPKSIWTVAGAKHANVYDLHPEEYRRVVHEFLGNSSPDLRP